MLLIAILETIALQRSRDCSLHNRRHGHTKLLIALPRHTST